MIDLRFGRYALCAGIAAAMLAGCGGRAGSGAVPANDAPNTLPGQQTFNYTGGAQNFKVPKGVKQIKVVARGGKGAGSPAVYPGRVTAVIPVKPGEELVYSWAAMLLAPPAVLTAAAAAARALTTERTDVAAAALPTCAPAAKSFPIGSSSPVAVGATAESGTGWLLDAGRRKGRWTDCRQR